MYKLKNIFLLCFLVVTAHVSFGQIFSAYSQYGLGILNNSSSPVQAAMGGIGAAFIDGANVNYTNPAALSVIEEATFDFGLRLNTRSIANSANLPFTVADGGVNNISLSFPVMKNRWGMSFGLLPYSFSKYKSNATRTFDGKNYTTIAEGLGSLYKIYLGNGFHYKGFRAGLNAELDGQTGVQVMAGDATMLYYMTEEGSEGKNAFLEKRKPDFSKFPRRP